MKQLLEFLITNKSTGIIKNSTVQFVDLGLDVLWADRNIGAEKETDYGHYYQWGGLESMDDKHCVWENAPFNNNQDEFDVAYFCRIKDKVAPNDILSKEYDIAYQTYKDNVRMPTKEECEQLFTSTIQNVIVKHINNNENVVLMEFRGKTGNSIFIPAGSCNMGNPPTKDELNKWCYIWTSTLYSPINEAFLLDVNCISQKTVVLNYNRCIGLNIRAVKDK